jgi:hypothetical protein
VRTPDDDSGVSPGGTVLEEDPQFINEEDEKDEEDE